MEIKEGDVVRLKSGGPVMTVQVITDGGSLVCAWFVKNVQSTGTFNPKAVMKVGG